MNPIYKNNTTYYFNHITCGYKLVLELFIEIKSNTKITNIELSFQLKSSTMKLTMVTSKLSHKTKKSKLFLTAILVLTHFSLFSSFFIQDVFADTVSNDNYSVDVNTIDTNPQPSPKSQVSSAIRVPPKDFTTGPNYTVISANDSLTVNLSQNIIDYGILSSTNPVIRTSKISLDNGLLGGEIFSYENHVLLSNTNDVIPNTSCDNGACTSDTAALWNNALTYGFGYRCESTQANACDPQFNLSDYFKPYAQGAQSPESVLVSNKNKSQASIVYKVNISGTQKTGGYYNSIIYLAVPNF